MSYSSITSEHDNRFYQKISLSPEFLVSLLFIVIFGGVIFLFRYSSELGESDLYRVLLGLMDGASSGQGLATDLHYDREFGFGYLSAIYAFVDPATLTDPDRLAEVMNQIGFWSIVPGLLFLWCAVRLVHGALAAAVALFIFALGPMVPELLTSGHQTIPMFSLLFAGATLLFLPAQGWRAVLAAGCGGALLLAGMTMRGELFLALPWIVLSRADTSRISAFIRSCCLRAIAPGLALVVFIVLQHRFETIVQSTVVGTVSNYFLESYSWATAVPGILYMSVGCGFATVAAVAAACLYLGWLAVSAGRAGAGLGLSEILGPAALIVVPLVFFLPNPVPPRHFLMPLAGMAIIIGVALARRAGDGRALALGLALGIGVGNQVLAEVARPALLRINEAHSPYLPVPTDYPTATHANLGWEWRRHAALLEKRARWRAFGDKLVTSCDTHVIVLSDEVEQIFSRLYAEGTPVEASRIIIGFDIGAPPINPALRQDGHGTIVGGGVNRLTGFIGKRQGKTFIMLDKSHLWPGDAVATLMADPAYDEYKLIADPYTLSRYDRTLVPPERAPRFGCPA